MTYFKNFFLILCVVGCASTQNQSTEKAEKSEKQELLVFEGERAQVLSDVRDIERFAAKGDCDEVISRGHALQEKVGKKDVLPNSVSAMIGLCEATKSTEKNVSDSAIKTLEALQRTAQSWYDKGLLNVMLAEKYLQSGLKDDAIRLLKEVENKNYETQKTLSQAIQSLQARLGIVPPSSATPAESPTAALPAVFVDVERSLTDARTAMNHGDPERAVNVLDAIPETLRNDRSKRLRNDAVEGHIRLVRGKVCETYTRGQNKGLDRGTRMDALQQCKQLLDGLLSRYPDVSSRSSIERNLRQITLDIEDLRKAG